MTLTIDAPTRVATRTGFRASSLGRLTLVELRKMADTRAGYWLLIATGLIAVIVVALQLRFAEPVDQTFFNLFIITLLPVGVLLPVLGILSVTSEWTQRTALTTFALVPGRHRLAIAKLLAAVVLALASVAACLATAAAGNLIGAELGDAPGGWSLGWEMIGNAVLLQLINIIMGVGFGMLLMNSALAIVLYFVVPTALTVLVSIVSALAKPAQWFDLGTATAPLYEAGGVTGDGWRHLASAVGVWVVLPLAAGLVRLIRREIA